MPWPEHLVVVADVADDEPVEGAAFAAGQAAVLEAIGALLLAAEAAAEPWRGFRIAGRADSARRTATRASALAARCDGAATPPFRRYTRPA